MDTGVTGRRRVVNGASTSITNTGTVVLFEGLITKVNAAVGLHTKYEFNDMADLSSLAPNNIVLISGCTDTAHNDGSFEIFEVSDTPGSRYIKVFNSAGTLENPAPSSAFCTYEMRKNLLDVASFNFSGLVPESKDAVECEYDGNNNMTKVKFYKGGTGGTKICEINMTYDVSGNLLSAERS